MFTDFLSEQLFIGIAGGGKDGIFCVRSQLKYELLCREDNFNAA